MAAPSGVACEPTTVEFGEGALDELDSALQLPPDADGSERILLGDIHGFVHVFSRREESAGFKEVWISEYFEGAVAGLFIADLNLDSLQEIIVFTDGGRFHFLDLADYHTIWSNPPNEYESTTAMILHNVDDDEQEELLFVADGRLVIYDGRDKFEEWRSDQNNIVATDLIVGDVDGDGAEEIVLNDGFVFDARFRDLEWQSPESFGERIGLLDIDDDDIPEIIGEYGGRYIRIFDIDLRRMKAARQ
ncbi:MAG: hypothetical protein VX733_05365 [Candidatus Latescibacterota bacterium]|nr:hypothetical protein [Candidatus Latescibacterota bacterium]